MDLLNYPTTWIQKYFPRFQKNSLFWDNLISLTVQFLKHKNKDSAFKDLLKHENLNLFPDE